MFRGAAAAAIAAARSGLRPRPGTAGCERRFGAWPQQGLKGAEPPPPPRLPPPLPSPAWGGGASYPAPGDVSGARAPPHPAELLLRPLPPPLAAPPPPAAPRPPGPGGGASMEEHLERLHARLQEELPNFFWQPHDFGLYAPDVEFVNRPLRLRTRGRGWYRLALFVSGAAARGCLLGRPRLELLALTRHRETWSLRARWRLTGRGRHAHRSFDALSTFYLDSRGLIRCHHIDRLVPTSRPLPPDKKLLVAALALVAPGGTPAPPPPAPVPNPL